jgi:hypothetical protein
MWLKINGFFAPLAVFHILDNFTTKDFLNMDIAQFIAIFACPFANGVTQVT